MVAPPALLSIVYASLAREPFDDERLRDLLIAARASNAAADVTGMLLYRDGRFIQFLEGPTTTVRGLVSKIAVDPRHSRMRVLLEDTVAARQFPDWTMGYRPAESGDAPEGFRHSFDDLDAGDDRDLMAQAARDLTLWFRKKPSAADEEPRS